MPLPSASASAPASRYAAHWVAEALAASDASDASDFSAVIALLDVSRESLAGASEAVTGRMALRCLQELAAADVGAAAAMGVLRVDDVSRSCQNLLVEIIAELREVDPEIAWTAPVSPVEQNGNTKHADQSLCNISHDHVLTDKHMFPTDNDKLQQKINLVNEIYTGNIQKGYIGDVGTIASSPENGPSNVDGNMSVPASSASASCDAALKGSATELLSRQDRVVHTASDQLQSCTAKSPNPPHRSGIERASDDGTCNQSSYDLSHGGPSMQSIETPAFDKNHDVLPTNASETSHLPAFITAQDTSIIPQADISKIHMRSLQHESGEKAIQDLDYDSANVPPVENDFSHEELTLRAASVLPSVSSNDAVQGDKSGTNSLPGKTTEHRALFEQENCGSNRKVILENYMVLDGLNVQSASVPHNVALHNKISEDNYFPKQNIGKNTTDVQKRDCSIAVPTGIITTDSLSCADKMLFCSNDQDTSGSPGDCSEQDVCIKCGKDGKLLKCSSCLLTAHDSCFVSSVMFEDSGQFYCPVCFYTKASEAYQKAKKTYCEARKNLAAFLGTKPLVKQQSEQLSRVLPIASHNEVHLSGYDSCQTEGHSLSPRDEVPRRQRKRQKTNATNNACPVELFTERASSVRNSDVETLNKPTILQDNGKRIQDAEKQQQVGNTETLVGAGNGNSYNRTRNSSHNKCSSSVNQEFEADKDNALINSSQSEEADEMELLPPLHNRHCKARLQKTEALVSSDSREVFVHQDQHMPSPLNYANPTNHQEVSNSVGPTKRRSKQCWTEEEAKALEEAMAKFAPQDNGTIPWAEILHHGRNVFHSARLPSDLRVKWRNMMKKAGS